MTLAVLACTVADGALEGPAPTPTLHTLLVRLPASIATRFVVYGVETDELILAPVGWRCTGLIGADGSRHVTIMDPTDEHAGVVVDSAPGAPYAGVLDLACPLFPDADRLLQSTFGFDCPRQHVPEEVLTTVSPEIVRFADPPGVRAVGALSGGPYPVSGALIYHAEASTLLAAFQASCAMPPEQGPMCDAIVGDWIQRVSATFNVAP